MFVLGGDLYTHKCMQRQFHCTNGRCIPNAWVCEGENDCGDNSDEAPALCKGRKLMIFNFRKLIEML